MVVGLGNPGKRYAGTPHNVGFRAVDELAGRWTCSLRRSLRFKARMGRATIEGQSLLLVQPQTFMNLSGRSVAAIMRYRKLTTDDVIVVSDDADLTVGRLRIRARGGSGGHRGLASIIDETGSDGFVRIRVGIGRGQGRSELVSHVLKPFASEELRAVDKVIELAADAVECVLSDGVESAMNRFNGTQLDIET